MLPTCGNMLLKKILSRISTQQLMDGMMKMVHIYRFGFLDNSCHRTCPTQWTTHYSDTVDPSNLNEGNDENDQESSDSDEDDDDVNE